MAENRFPHIFIKEAPKAIDYISSKKGGGEINIPKRNRQSHGNFLKKKFKELWKQSNTEIDLRKILEKEKEKEPEMPF